MQVEEARGWLRERQRVLATFVASRLVVAFTAYVATWQVPGSSGWGAPLTQLATWDGGHYRHLAEFWYSVGSPAELDRFVFFPLWPLLMRVVAFVLPKVGVLEAGILLANVLCLIAVLWLRSLLLRETGSVEIADRACIYLLIFPSAYVLSMSYGDSLFLLLSVVCFDCLRRRRWWLAALFGLLAGLSRAQGAILSLAALIEAISYLRAASGQASARRWRQVLAPLAAVIAPGLGVLLYLGYVQIVAGDALLPIRRQWRPGWKDRPVVFVFEIFSKIFDKALYPDVLLGVIALTALIVVIYSFWRLPASFAVYSLVSVIAATSARNFVSVDRYVLDIFPFFWVVAMIGTREWFDAGYRVVAPTLMGALALLAWNGNWVP